MRLIIAAASIVSVLILAPAAVWSLGAGNPAELMSPGRYQVGFEWVESGYQLSGQEYLGRGYLIKVQGSVRPGLDLYLRAGREGIKVEPGGGSTEFKGDSRLSLGGGLKLAVWRLPRHSVESFVDVGGQSFHSVGTTTYTQEIGGVPSTTLLQNDYRWSEIQAAWGFRREQGLLSPFAGLSLSWLWLHVDREQLSVSGSPTETGRISQGPRYRAFGGVDFRVTDTLRLSLEMSHRRSDTRPWFTVSLSERTD